MTMTTDEMVEAIKQALGDMLPANMTNTELKIWETVFDKKATEEDIKAAQETERLLSSFGR